VTLIEQLAAAPNVAPQLWVSLKSPLTEMPEMLKLAFPLFVNVTA